MPRIEGQVVEEGYKVVPYKNLLVSSHSPVTVSYKRRGWVQPPPGCGPLAVFKDELDAQNFAGIHDMVVYKCWYVASSERRFWFSRRYDRRVYAWGLIPRGTCFADSVYLTKLRRKWSPMYIHRAFVKKYSHVAAA